MTMPVFLRYVMDNNSAIGLTTPPWDAKTLNNISRLDRFRQGSGCDNSDTPTGFDTVMDYSQNPVLLAHFGNSNLLTSLMELLPLVLRPGVKSISHRLCLALRTVPTPTASLDHEFFLKELFFYSYGGIANEMKMLIMFRLMMRLCGTCTSFEVLELFKVSIQSLIPISEVIFVIPNDK
ncbi:hypothetical protein L2E82_49002 [Cichorium intybus]|uniref:Uncharacterized protein n=1 Tax=Cichorium intybus TaxID=13427 RepID=A0ACB8YYG5_CICIN|nr:hypothetical protein L2E82_49002 [Cichorium intybus]